MIERHATSSALHNDRWTQATQHTRPVVFRRLELRNNNLVIIWKQCLTSRAGATTGVCACEAERFCAGDAEDVAASRDHRFLVELLAAFQGVAAEVVVHRGACARIEVGYE